MEFRSKYDHTVRVFGWNKRLANGIDDVDTHALYMAAIFHDIWYSEIKGKEAHADMSAKIFSEYAIKRRMKPAFIEKVRKLIELHSSKQLLKETKI